MVSSRITGANETVRTFGAAGFGRDYTSTLTWEQAWDIALTTQVPPRSEVLECYDDAATFETAIIIDGATTSASYRRIIRAAPGQGHNGTPSTGVHLVRTAGTGNPITMTEGYCSLQDIIITQEINTTGQTSGVAFAGTSTHRSVIGCIFYNCTNLGTGAGYGVRNAATGGINLIVNCIVIGSKTGGVYSGTAADTYVYNTTSVTNGNRGVDEFAGNLICKNVLCALNTGNQFNSIGSTGNTNNAATDTTAPGTNSRQSQTFTFANAGSDDYHLASNDAGALGFGANLAADGVFAFDDDIDGNTITTWSIGAHSPSAGGVQVSVFYAHLQTQGIA